MKAIVDCNSFYCSCERLFRPSLDNEPVVVFSNNDGCVIARSDEAKAAGIAMGIPYFQAKALLEEKKVATFSSNYNLYGDMSWRVMETLRQIVGSANVEVYSVDEAFLDLSTVPKNELQQTARHILETVEEWTGIKVSIGVAPTKVLAKVANRLAKKHKQATGCVLVLDSPRKLEQALERTPVADIWGIGRKYADKLVNEHAVFTAFDLSRRSPEWARTHLGGVVGARFFKELNGEPTDEIDRPFVTKKMIATSRMFGEAVSSLAEIKEAIATYTSRAAEKLRRQKSAASVISVFVVPRQDKYQEKYKHAASVSALATLSTATSITNDLIKPAVQLVDQLFQQGCFYKKAGVLLSGLVPDNAIQTDLFTDSANHDKVALMEMVDNVNFAMRDDLLKFAASGTTRNWKMRQGFRSPRYTSRWEEIATVR